MIGDLFAQRATTDPEASGSTSLIVITVLHDTLEQRQLHLPHHCLVKIIWICLAQLFKVGNKTLTYRATDT